MKKFDEKIEACIFDYGGTIDTHGDHWAEVFWEIYQHIFPQLSKDMFRQAYVYAERALAKHPYIKPDDTFLTLLDVKTKLQISYLEEAKKIFFNSKNEQSRQEIVRIAYQKVGATTRQSRIVLSELADRYPMVLVSNFYGNIQTVLAEFRLDAFFPKIIESAVVGIRKPDPRIYQLGVDALAIPSDRVVVIGDSYEKDIIPATSIGCKAIWIEGKTWDEDTKQIPYPWKINNFTTLRDLLLV